MRFAETIVGKGSRTLKIVQLLRFSSPYDVNALRYCLVDAPALDEATDSFDTKICRKSIGHACARCVRRGVKRRANPGI